MRPVFPAGAGVRYQNLTLLDTQPYIAIAIAMREQTLFIANRIAYPAATGVACLFACRPRHGEEVP